MSLIISLFPCSLKLANDLTIHACIHCTYAHDYFLNYYTLQSPCYSEPFFLCSQGGLQYNHLILVTLYLLIDPHIHDELENTPSVSAIARLDLKLCVMDFMLILWKIIYM